MRPFNYFLIHYLIQKVKKGRGKEKECLRIKKRYFLICMGLKIEI